MTDGIDMNALLEQAQHMQDRVLAAGAAAAEQVVEGRAGGGAVKVRINGAMDFQSVTIDPEAVDPDDLAMLEDLVRAACNDAVARAREIGQQALGALGSLALGADDLGGRYRGELGPP